MKIYLIRHTSVNSDSKMCYGWTDVDVSDNFKNEADRIRDMLEGEDCVFYSSDLKRCVKLAGYLSEKVMLDKDLREMNFGDWEGQSWTEIEKTFIRDEPSDFVNKNAPNGESYVDQQSRVLRSWNKIIEKKEEKVAIVAHGGSIRIILCEVLGMPLKNAFRIKIDYGSITEISIDKKFITVDRLNL